MWHFKQFESTFMFLCCLKICDSVYLVIISTENICVLGVEFLQRKCRFETNNREQWKSSNFLCAIKWKDSVESLQILIQVLKIQDYNKEKSWCVRIHEVSKNVKFIQKKKKKKLELVLRHCIYDIDINFE